MAKDKKDISVLIEGQLPEFVTTNHPKFKKFIEKYYEFMESHELYFDGITFHEFKLIPEDVNFDFFSYEDGDRIQLESERDTASNANLQFVIGETVTGNTSGATALVTGTKGNTHVFVKPTNNAVFKFAEQITGGTSRAYSTLANGIFDGTFPEGAIESFRSRGAVAATRELSDMQDIDKTNEGLIDDAWKKEFYTNVPRTTKTDRRQLLKRMKEVYRSKGNESSFTWLFRAVFAKEDVEFYYPKNDLMKLSDGRWSLDKTIKIVTSAAVKIELFTGRRITGASSKCTAIVEKAVTTSVGALLITEMTLSDVIQGTDDAGELGFFKVNERVDTEVDIYGNYGYGYASGLVMSVSVDVGGTEYTIGDEIIITGGGGQDAKARVASIAENVVEGISILDSGDGFSVGDVLAFVDEGTGGSGASGRVGTIIKTGEVIINSDIISSHKLTAISASDFGTGLVGHNANTHLYGNSAVIFQSTIKASSAKYFDSTSPMWNTQFITAGDQLRKQVTFDETDVGQLTQSGTTVTFATGMTHQQTRDVVGAKLTYANSNTNIITGYTNTTVFLVRDTHTISSAQNWDIYYGSNTTWGTIIGANSSQILYSVGSYYRDPDLDVFSANNFANDDYVILYDAARTKAWAAKSANSHDAQMMHNGITLQFGNTPASINTHSEAATANISYVDAFGQTGPGNTVTFVTRGALNTTTKNVGAINTCTITAGGEKYQAEPLVTVANNYILSLNNTLDVMGANNSLVNLNLHSYDTGTITQSSNVVTLTGGAFPDANSGVLKLIYANGAEDHITAVTNSTSIRTTLEKSFGINDDPQTYSLTYMAMANNFARTSYLYNDDWTARACVLDFIDKAKTSKPVVPTGNTTLRLDMYTVQDFSSREQFFQYEINDFSNDTDLITFEDGNKALQEDCVEFLSQEDGLGVMLFEDGFRIFNESTSGERVTAYSSTVSTANSGTIAQSGTTVTLTGAAFPNDLVRGTITYSGHNDSTAIITGYTNSTIITVDTSKTINASNTYSIDYNGAVTWGINRTVTAAGSGTGNRTVTVTDTAHYLRFGDKVKITGALSAFVNGIHVIEVIDDNSYRFILPHDGVASVTGDIRSRGVVSAWLSSANAYTVDGSPKGNNATLAVSAIAIGAIKTVEVYNFGAGYTELPTLTTTTGNRNAELTATLGAYAEYAGYYVGSKGLISGTPKIQDNFYYQDFSYVLKTDLDITDYRDSVKRLTHPSGMLLFGEVAFRNKVSVEMFDAGERNVNSIEPDTGKTAATATVPKYRLTLPTINSYANVKYQTFSSNNELEIYTANHPWQAMDGKIDVRGDENLLYEDFRDVTMQRTSTIGANAYATITEPFHNLEVGDEIQITDATSDYFNGKYLIYSVPTGNTYTVYMYRGDPGASVTAVAQTAYGNGWVKVETLSFANTWRANTTNWESPFNTALIDELDSERFLLEHGGSFLYPLIKFPMAESGTVSIDMSFNSDVLLESYTTGDLGMSDSGYLLDEAAGGAGNGPARYISLEEDTEGIEEGHIAQSIPYMETAVTTNLLDSMRQGLLTENVWDEKLGQYVDGTDDLVLESFTVDDFDLILEDGLLLLEDGFIVLKEDGENVPLELNEFKLLQDDGRIGYPSASLLGFIVVEFGHYRPEERRRLITEHNAIIDGSYFAAIYTDHLSTSILGRMLYEDGDIIFGEDTFGGFLTEITSPPIDKEIEFDLLDSIRGGLQTEDGLDYIVGEDADPGEGVQASKFISEQPPFERTPVIIHDPLISPSGRLIMEDTEATLLAFEDSGVNIKSYVIEEGKFAYKMIMRDVDIGETQFDIYDTTGWHFVMEDGPSSHLVITEDGFDVTQESGDGYFVLESFTEDDTVEHLIHEDGTRALTEEGIVKTGIGEIEYNLVESTGWHILAEDGVEHLTYEDGTRLLIDDIEFQTSLHIPIVLTDDITQWTIDNYANNSVATATSQTVTSTYGMQPFRPQNVSQWPLSDTGMFVDDKFAMEDDTGVIILEHPFGNRNYLMHEDYPAAGEDIMNPLREELHFILLEEGSVDFILYEEDTITGTSQGLQRALLEVSKVPEDGYGSDYTPNQYWSVLPAYQYTKILERFTGKITFADEGTAGTGSDTLFTTELRVGDEFQTADENIIDEDSGGSIIFETDERIQHEDITISDVQNVGLTTLEWELVPSVDFRWLMNNEDSDKSTHPTHSGVIGTYFSWNSGFYFVTGESTLDVKVAQEDDGGIIQRQTPEWENNNMLWEDGQKQLITEPQAFIVGSIANDTTLSVTRKHLGGVSDSVYQM